ncbi:MAG: TIGR03790 family protein [Planctomycetota bacterium]|nr:TIGR03790 family protein [Planctomycetota bacterium]
MNRTLARLRRSGPALLLLAVCSPAWSLTPAEVLVVANRKLPESVELAKLYMQLRHLPPENVALLDMPTTYEIGRADYEKDIRVPIGRFLQERQLDKQIRCLVLMWGVPVRVMEGEDLRQKEAVYQSAVKDSLARIVMLRALVEKVGSLPPKQPDLLLPPEGQFPPVPPPAEPTLAPDKLKDQLADLIAARQVEVARIADPGKKRAFSRQVMALTLEGYGLSGLIRYLTSDSPPDAPPVEPLRKQLADIEAKIQLLRGEELSATGLKKKIDLLRASDGVVHLHGYAEQYANRPAAAVITDPVKTPNAAVDSELSLLWWGAYPVEGWMINPLHWTFAEKLEARPHPPVLMTSRLDGPTPALAARMLRDSVAVERSGLTGTFYIDAGGPARLGNAAAAMDNRLKQLAALARDNTRVRVVLDTSPQVFAPGACPDAALYVGWYSLRKYVPAFTWARGAVGYHIASFEAVALRAADSPEWCPQMISTGVAATIGPVAEPFLGAFPLPEEFFSLLLTGHYTLAECYWRTVPQASWQMILLGDGLYNPFAANPQLDPRVLPPGLAPRVSASRPASHPASSAISSRPAGPR